MGINDGGSRRSRRPARAPGYHRDMTTTFDMGYTSARRKALNAAIARVLTPAQLTMVRELMQAEDPHGPALRAEQVMQWLRVNMPSSAVKIEEDLYPAD